MARNRIWQKWHWASCPGPAFRVCKLPFPRSYNTCSWSLESGFDYGSSPAPNVADPMWATPPKLLKATTTKRGVYGFRNPLGRIKAELARSLRPSQTVGQGTSTRGSTPLLSLSWFPYDGWDEIRLDHTKGLTWSLGSWEGTAVPWLLVWKHFLE